MWNYRVVRKKYVDPQRKQRKGAFWEDRYHATAVESGDHLARCIAYIDTNMVRAGVVSHPSMWTFSGYNEIQSPRRKNILIDFERLRGLVGSKTYAELRESHRGWIEEYLGNGPRSREDQWTASIAVGGMSFIDKVKAMLGFRSKGRKAIEGEAGWQLRERESDYNAGFGSKKDDIRVQKTYFWDTTST